MVKDKNNLISLKEASQLSGYSADYVGQLIRQGKIPGKQVYCNIAWMTTAEAVLAYKQNSRAKDADKGFKAALSRRKHKIGLELNTVKLFFENFRSAWPLLAVAVITLLLFNVCILYFFFAPKERAVSAQDGTEKAVEASPESALTY